MSGMLKQYRENIILTYNCEINYIFTKCQKSELNGYVYKYLKIKK